jgi:hypothetical protein
MKDHVLSICCLLLVLSMPVLADYSENLTNNQVSKEVNQSPDPLTGKQDDCE